MQVAIFAKFKKTIITFAVLAVICAVCLLAGSTPGEVVKCAISMDPDSVECTAMVSKDTTTTPVLVPAPTGGQSAPEIVTPAPAQ